MIFFLQIYGNSFLVVISTRDSHYCVYAYIFLQERWVRIVGGDFTVEDNFCADLRRLQQRNGCSDSTCEDILGTFKKYLNIVPPKSIKSYDKKLHAAAGATMLRLNGCVKCKRHVYLPTDKATCCPHVDATNTVCGHPRYGDDGKPLEVCVPQPLPTINCFTCYNHSEANSHPMQHFVCVCVYVCRGFSTFRFPPN